MDMSPERILNIARTDPRLALAILRRPVKSEIMYGVRAQFADVAVNQTKQVQFKSALCDDIYFYDRSYQIRQNNATGAVFRGVQVVGNALNSGIDARIEYQNCPGHLISTEFWPIEQMGGRLAGFTTPPIDNDSGFFLPFGTNVNVTFTNTRAFVAPDEIPTDVFMTWYGWALGCSYEKFSMDEAVATLKGVYKLDLGK